MKPVQQLIIPANNVRLQPLNAAKLQHFVNEIVQLPARVSCVVQTVMIVGNQDCPRVANNVNRLRVKLGKSWPLVAEHSRIRKFGKRPNLDVSRVERRNELLQVGQRSSLAEGFLE